MTLQGKTLVITGVSSGIGAELARLARFQGARVIGVDRNDPLLSLAAFHRADLGDAQAIAALVERLPERVDGLCNVAGVPGTAPLATVARVNYLGPRLLAQRLLPRLAPGGCIVNVASVLGAEWPQRLAAHGELAAIEGFAQAQRWLEAQALEPGTAYQYFKEALIVWTLRQAPRWFRQHGVRLNCVAPGPVFTPILGDFVEMLGAERVARDSERIVRPALADEVAEVIAFLCSDAARWVNGVNLPVDAGLAASYV